MIRSKTIRFGPKGKLRILRTGSESMIWVFMQSSRYGDVTNGQYLSSKKLRPLLQAGLQMCDEIDAAKE